jgi:outer membrane protein
LKTTAFLLALILAPAAAAPGRAGVPAPPPAAPATTLTLQEALERALAANPALGRARAEVAAAEATKDTAVSAILPRVGVQGNFTHNTENVSFGSGSDSRVILPSNDWNYRLTLSQPIYAGNRERKALEQARLGIASARAGALSAEDQLILSVVADYLAVLDADELIAVEQKNVEVARRSLAQAQDLFQAGETTKVDALRGETAEKSAERALASARQAREAAAGRLRLDLALDGPVAVKEPGQIFPARPAEAELVRQAEDRRPEVAQAKTALAIARLEVGKQRGALLPVVTADGAYIDQKAAFPASRYGYLALHLNVPLYQGGEVAARVAVARERQRQAELRVAELQQGVREEVRQALVALQTADANLTLAREQLAASAAEYEQAAELYRAQEITALEAATAETSLAEARRAAATGKFDRDVAELRVWAAAGLIRTALPEGAR